MPASLPGFCFCVAAETSRSKPVTNLLIPEFCITEITDDWRFSNDGLAEHPYSSWKDRYIAELDASGPQFHEAVSGRTAYQPERCGGDKGQAGILIAGTVSTLVPSVH